jgi:ABC-type antimicrobial peptide transport system permease subunit
LGLVISIGPQIAIIEVAVPISFWLYVFSVALGSLAFAVIVSVAAGLYPAYRAARMEPVEAFAYVW